MSDNRMGNLFQTYTLAFMAGSLGGILAGFVEVLLVARFGTHPANFSGLLFAVVAYGLMGGMLGKVFYLFLSFLPFHREKRSDRRLLSALILAKSTAAILFLIFVFRAFRDFHAEKVKPASPTGLVTILVLIVAAAGVFFLIQFLMKRPGAGFLATLTRPIGYFALIIVLLVVGLVLQKAFIRETESVTLPYNAAGAPKQEKPNVILIQIDAFRADRLSCYGSTNPLTPNMDALARDGVIFRQTYSQTNNTKPSTASLLSSRYPSEHQALHKTDILSDNIITLAEVFGEAGYFCGGIVSNVNLAPIYNFQQGFHEYIYLPPKFLLGANEAASRLVIYGVLRLIRMRVNKSIWVHNFYRSGETVTNYFSEFLSRHRANKFFLFIHYMDPHDPFFEHPYNGKGYARVIMENPPAQLVEPFKRNYAQEVEYTDQWIGRVISELKAAGLYESSLIVLTADHGEEFYEHGGWWHGTTLQEEQLRIPLLFKLPGNKNAGLSDDSLAGNIDIAPTLLTEAGLSVPPAMRGIALFDSAGQIAMQSQVYCEADFEGNIAQMLRIGPWKYIQTNPENPRRRPVEQLYYLTEDPSEEHNIANSRLQKVAEMKALLSALQEELLSTRETGAQRSVDRATQERLRALGYTQ